MKEAQVILNRLLDKFENSKHLSEPNTSRRRVMLRIDKRELPEYQYEDAVVRDAYNIAARELEQQAARAALGRRKLCNQVFRQEVIEIGNLHAALNRRTIGGL